MNKESVTLRAQGENDTRYYRTNYFEAENNMEGHNVVNVVCLPTTMMKLSLVYRLRLAVDLLNVRTRFST